MNDPVLSSGDITKNLRTGIIGCRVLYYPTLISTMDTGREVGREDTPEGTVIVAGEQTAGRGRLKRSWLAPRGNIALSVLLFPRLAELPEMIMLASLAVVRSIESVTGFIPQIKWPNDVLIDGKKVCGILIESDARPTDEKRVAYVNIGIGINVNLQPGDFSEIEATATSLSVTSQHEVSRLAVIRALLTEMDKLYLDLKAGKSLFEEWRRRLVTLGKPVKVTAADTVYEGTAEGVERDGSLLVRCTNGELRRVVAGDVSLKDK
jgi:BirA family transcriptional regulator, biotin operon repressor / biotin---[acetyl-CoA-carboxylase] ligase